MNETKNQGYTLLEILVVISIIGLLTATILVAVSSARSKSRDAVRISDMEQISRALDLYYDKHGNYPNFTSSVLATNWCNMITALRTDGFITHAGDTARHGFRLVPVASASFAPTCVLIRPLDPLSPAQSYGYMVSKDQQNYRIRAQLENTNNGALANGVTGSFLSSGDGGCDKSLGYYCLGDPNTFVPGP